MICLREVVKRYDQTLALDRLSLEVPEGAIFGLLGPNGAGKTTILRLIMGFLFASSGEVDRGGLTPSEIGYLPERAFYPPRFGIREYLLTSARLAGLGPGEAATASDRLLTQLGLGGVATGRKKLGACSRGMLQRLGLAQAMIGNPALLLLDEPASGLDPAGQKFMREQILTLQEAGKTILLSSHHLDEVTRVCSHVAVISQGRLVRSGPLEGSDGILALQAVSEAMVIILARPLLPDLLDRLAALSPEITVAGERIVLAGRAVEHKADVLRLLLESGADIQHLSERQATLEEIYLEATGG
jgi:ABC-2 type transport system ATP-binding protein